ncbi:MAG: phosphate ABC transporter permease subunit PstC, partial [Eggerthellaceae bacterium]|nr:phosphate ABC transporter permease subunit PstC [Eggerthellaceae bacterium]
MRKALDSIGSFAIAAFAAVALLSLAFVIYFIVREALPLFETVSVQDFLLGTRWMPVDFGTGTSFGIFNFIAATVAVSFLALAFAVLVGIGTAVFLASSESHAVRSFAYPFIDLLAGVPSVVYGFVGLLVVVRLFMKAGVTSGLCVLGAAIVLAVMLLPFLISACSDSLLSERNRYLTAAQTLGISRWSAMATIILPAATRNILLSLVLAMGRAMGETMAVMMVIGNANVFPSLLGKGETIPAVIALEMGTAVAGSDHYHALFAAGMVLMLILLAINLLVAFLRNSLAQRGGKSVSIGGHGGKKAGIVVRVWAIVSIAVTFFAILFLFGYIFWQGSSTISWEMLTQPPRGMVLGEEGGIAPAIAGSLAFTVCAVVLGGIP